MKKNNIAPLRIIQIASDLSNIEIAHILGITPNYYCSIVNYGKKLTNLKLEEGLRKLNISIEDYYELEQFSNVLLESNINDKMKYMYMLIKTLGIICPEQKKEAEEILSRNCYKIIKNNCRNSSMIVNYSDQNVIKGKKSIFLAGPTPRSTDVESWRIDAIQILNNIGFDGIVYIPEKVHDDRTYDYTNQVWWEREALFSADVIAFWIPRNLDTMPAFTTNVEFGYWLSKNSSKVIYGRPDESEKNKYLDWLYQTETDNVPLNNLENLLKNAVEMINNKQSEHNSAYSRTLEKEYKGYRKDRQ